MKNYGTISGNPLSLSLGSGGVPNSTRITDSAIMSGQAKLISELEKRDPILREPLTSVTYTRDIPIDVGGGWVDSVSAMFVNYGVSGGSGTGSAAASGANDSKIIQANVVDGKWGAHVFDITMQVKFVDLQRNKIIGRNIDQIYSEGIRLNYDKHAELNSYLGLTELGTTGLMNNVNVPARMVVNGASTLTAWLSKTPDEILRDINTAITQTWERSEHDLSALPNHILLPYEQFNYIASAKVSEAADKSILTYILENNSTKINGGELFVGATNFCKGQGTGATDRMVVYNYNKKFIKMEELVSLSRAMTQPVVGTHSYDSLYLANLSELQLLYEETVGYFDGI